MAQDLNFHDVPDMQAIERNARILRAQTVRKLVARIGTALGRVLHMKAAKPVSAPA